MEGCSIIMGLWMKIKVQTAQDVPLTRIVAEPSIDPKTTRKLRDAPGEPAVTRWRRRSQLDAYAERIRERLEAGVPAAQLAGDLAWRGITVAYPMLRAFARKLGPPKAARGGEGRFEAPPAE